MPREIERYVWLFPFFSVSCSCLTRQLYAPICRVETAADRLVSHGVAWKTRAPRVYAEPAFMGIVNSGRCCRGCAEVELSKGKYGYLGCFGTMSNVWTREWKETMCACACTRMSFVLEHKATVILMDIHFFFFFFFSRVILINFFNSDNSSGSVSL